MSIVLALDEGTTSARALPTDESGGRGQTLGNDLCATYLLDIRGRILR